MADTSTLAAMLVALEKELAMAQSISCGSFMNRCLKPTDSFS